MVWRTARFAGTVRRWLTSSWRRLALWVLAIAAGLWIVDRWITPISSLSVLSILVLAVLFAFGRAVWLARDRIVIEPFLDHTRPLAAGEGSDATPPPAIGLNDSLVAELASRRDLFTEVGERAVVDPAVGGSGEQAVKATLEVQDVSEFLRNAATADATVSLGALTLPIGTVMAMLGRLAQGPRVSGSIQVVATGEGNDGPGKELHLSAYYASTNRLASWTVRAPLPDYAAGFAEENATGSLVQTHVVQEMVEELAARIFADLGLKRGRSWQATRRFLDGLRQYRLAEESQQDRVLKLRRAQRSFVEALADDPQLPLARYNLGVVYRQLFLEGASDAAPGAPDFSTAAENAFRGELDRESAGWQPYYALAVTCYDQSRHADVASLCDRVIELSEGATRRAIAYKLKGLADRLRPTVNPQLGLALAIDSRRRAVAYALLALTQAELKGQDPSPARGLAAGCLLDLGIGLAYEAQAQEAITPQGVRRRRATYKKCRSLLCTAARLEDSFGPHVQLGKIAVEFGEPDVAVREFRAAMRINPTSALCWAWLAKVNASLSEGARPTDEVSAEEWERRAWDAIRLARNNLNVESVEVSEAVEELAEAFDLLGEDSQAAAMRDLIEFQQSLEGETDATVLSQQFSSEPDGWKRGQLAKRLGYVYRDAGDHVSSEQSFRDAIQALADYPLADYREEIRRSGLRGEVAMSLAFQEVPHRALREAQAAISVNPMSSWEREVLGYIHDSIGDLDSAISAYEDALCWRPRNPSSLHTSLGRLHLRLADDLPQAVQRTDMYLRAIRHLQDALDLQAQTDLAERVKAHYWLGSAFTEADAYERAVPHFKNALAAGESRSVVQVMLGQAYVRMKRYEDAEEVLGKAVKAADAAASFDPRLKNSGPIGEEWLAADLAAAAHRTLALSFIARNARLDDAGHHIEESDRLLDLLGDDAPVDALASGRELEGRILLQKGEREKAIAMLEKSVGLAADVEAYFHLAHAYAAAAAAGRSKAAIRRALEQARQACRLTRDLDRSKMFAAGVDELLAELFPQPAEQTEEEEEIEEPAGTTAAR